MKKSKPLLILPFADLMGWCASVEDAHSIELDWTNACRKAKSLRKHKVFVVGDLLTQRAMGVSLEGF